MKIVTSVNSLFTYAKQLKDARKIGDRAVIEQAEQNLKNYEQFCLKADKMLLHCTRGFLDNNR